MSLAPRTLAPIAAAQAPVKIRCTSSDQKVISEVVSRSKELQDQSAKRVEYLTQDSLNTIVFVDPGPTSLVIRHLGPTAWRNDMRAQLHDVACLRSQSSFRAESSHAID